MNDEPFLQKYRMEILLAGILIFSAFLNIWNIWNQGYSNSYYAAAVRSMLANPGVLFFNSFDAGGFVTVDKPPVGLWVQAASAALLGFSGWALVLPQALAGVGSVALVYAIVSRPFGKPAGLVAAVALAITPIFVAVSRNGTMDGILIFVLLLAVWTALKAARENSLPFLLAAVTLVGIGFNIKMIQAFIVVPAILAVYLLGAGGVPFRNRLLHIGLAIAVLSVVSLSWAVAVDMVPADQRPYIGGSGDNTVMGLIVNYNGLHRLEENGQFPGGNGGVVPGGSSGPQAGPGDMQPGMAPYRNQTTDQQRDRTVPYSGSLPGQAMSLPEGSPPSGTSPQDLPVQGGRSGGGMMDETGTPGALRLFSSGLAGQISWLLPFALIGLFAWIRRPAEWSLNGLEDAGYFSEKAMVLLAMCLWLFPGLLYFSFTTGFWHTYYLATIAPPLAALAGIGAAGMYRAYTEGGMKSWILVAAILVTGVVGTLILTYNEVFSGILILVLINGTLGLTVILAALNIRKNHDNPLLPRYIAAIAIGLLFIAPFVWACTPLVYGSGSSLPVAGPQLARGGGNNGPGGSAGPGNADSNSGLTEFLISHHDGEQWIVAVSSSHGATDIIMSTGEPVMALGGFSGSDRILTTESLQSLIGDGKIRYFYLSSGSGDRGGSGGGDISSWVSNACTVVPSLEYSSGTVAGRITGGNDAGGEILYDCKDAAGS
jgi:4-amino-4-deoxy-L-arabinose transferase-like glycosyltransferase